MHLHPRRELGLAAVRADSVAVREWALRHRRRIVDLPLELGEHAVARHATGGQGEAEGTQPDERSLVVIGRPRLERSVAACAGASRRLLDCPGQDRARERVVEPGVAAPHAGVELRLVLPTPCHDAVVGSPESQPLGEFGRPRLGEPPAEIARRRRDERGAVEPGSSEDLTCGVEVGEAGSGS